MARDDLSEDLTVGRLKRRADFLRVAAQSATRSTEGRRKWAAPNLILQVSNQPPSIAANAPAIRIGFTASRKVGNAVLRNRARRRLKAVAAELLGTHARTGLDLVLIARTATCDCPFDDLRRDLLQGLKRTKAARTLAEREVH